LHTTLTKAHGVIQCAKMGRLVSIRVPGAGSVLAALASWVHDRQPDWRAIMTMPMQ
jgi:hypothetical protein